MDAYAEEDLARRIVHRDPATLPALNQVIGIKYPDSASWLPYTVKEIGAKVLRAVSPYHGKTTLFAFDFEDPWIWVPWDDVPKQVTGCDRCDRKGEILTSANEIRECPKCRGNGVIAKDDPFEAAY